MRKKGTYFCRGSFFFKLSSSQSINNSKILCYENINKLTMRQKKDKKTSGRFVLFSA